MSIELILAVGVIVALLVLAVSVGRSKKTPQQPQSASPKRAEMRTPPLQPAQSTRAVQQQTPSLDYDDLPDEFVVFDLETTGLSPQSADIIEIAAVKCRREQFAGGDLPQRYGEFQSLIYVDEVPDKITRITGITSRMLKRHGREEEKVLAEFKAFVGDAPMLSYNVRFDRKFLEFSGSVHDIVFSNEFDCILQKSQRVFDGLANYKLPTVAAALGIAGAGEHRAMPDTLIALRIYVRAVSIESAERKRKAAERQQKAEAKRLEKQKAEEARLAERARELGDRICKHCGAGISPALPKGAVHCSPACAQAAKELKAREREERAKAEEQNARERKARLLTDRQCKQCGNYIPRARPEHALFCSMQCASVSRETQGGENSGDGESQARVCVQCGEEIPPSKNPKALYCCSKCGKAAGRKRKSQRAKLEQQQSPPS